MTFRANFIIQCISALGWTLMNIGFYLIIFQYTNSIGSVELQGTWTDPEFDPHQNAFYYVRVLEIPTPRWSMFDAKALGIPHPPDVNETIQERAFTSPIWYSPDS